MPATPMQPRRSYSSRPRLSACKSASWTYTQLLSDPLFAALPLQHALASRKSINAKDFNDLPFISYPKDPNSRFSKQALRLLEAAGGRPRVGYEAKEIHTALGLVAAGLGGTMVGKTVATNNRTDVRFLPIKGLKNEAKIFIVRQKNQPNALADAFQKVLLAQSNK